MSAEDNENDLSEMVERLRKRVEVLEKRLWDLEIAVEQSATGTVPPPPGPAPERSPRSGGSPLKSDTGLLSNTPLTTTTRVPVPEEQPFEVVEVDGRLSGESEEGFDYVWQVTVQSLSDTNHKLKARICFVDLHSQVVDEVEARGLVLFAGRKQKFTGKHSIGAASQEQVTGVKAFMNLDED